METLTVNALLPLLVGAAGLLLLAKVDSKHLAEILELLFPKSQKLQYITKKVLHVALAFLACSLLIEPLIPGRVRLKIVVDPHAEFIPGLLEHLRAKVVPVGLLGEGPAERITYPSFDSSGSVELFCEMRFLETSIKVELFDETQPYKTLPSLIVSTSPFSRQQIVGKTVSFEKGDQMKTSRIVVLGIILVSILCFAAQAVDSALQVTSLRDNANVSGEVQTISGTGAEPGSTFEVSVLTNAWYPQDGQVQIENNGNWTYSPVFLSGKGVFNNHTIKITQIKNGQRGKSVTVKNIVRK